MSTTTLDPAIVEMERRWQDSGIPGLYEGMGPEMRERARCIRALLYPKPRLPAGRIEPITIPSPAGGIPARVIQPASGQPSGATLVYYHGGGWIVGDLDSHEAHAIRLANATGAVVLNVGYRLAPEDPFPAGVDDAIAAFEWAHANVARLGGDAARVAVGGDSAGGNLAAVLAVHARNRGLPLAAQLLLYPATDLTRMREDKVRNLYLGLEGEASLERARDWRVSPRLASSLAGVAPAIIGVGPFDFLYQDNLAHAAALREAGVQVLLREYPTLNHGFFSYTAISRDSERAAEQLAADLRDRLAR